MNDRETARYDRFVRVRGFGKDNDGDFAPGSEAKTRFATLDQIIKDLDAEKAKQKPEGATAKSVLLDALRLDVANITRSARSMDNDEPGFSDKFRAPKTASDGDLLTAADAIIARLVVKPGDDAATQAAKAALVARFVAKELPATFATDLNTDRQTIEGAKDTQEKSREGGVKATSAVDKLIADGQVECEHLDAIMHNKYARNADKLRAWMSAAHIERAPQRAKKPAPAPPQ